jgi:tripartite ATP-independent transporter DctP family solute receptor
MDRRHFIIGSSAAVAATNLAAPRIARGAGTLNMRFAHFGATDHPSNVAAKQFADRVRERTGGAIKITVYPNNALGDPAQQAQQIKSGVIDIGLPTQGQLDKYQKAFAAVPLPFLFNDRAEVFKVLDGPAMDWLAPLAAQEGFITLRNWDYGFRNLTNNRRPVNTPDDVKGLKIRTPPEVQIASCMEALGGIVTTISFPEVYLALSQGVVDGEENPIAVIFFNQYFEVQKHLALTRHVYNNMILTVGAQSWQKLSPEQQAIFREEGTRAGDLMRRLIGEQEEDQIAKIAAGGVQVTHPALGPFRDKMGPAYEKVSAYAGADNVAKMRGIVDKVRQG